MGRTASVSVEARPTLASVWWTLALLLLTTGRTAAALPLLEGPGVAVLSAALRR